MVCSTETQASCTRWHRFETQTFGLVPIQHFRCPQLLYIMFLPSLVSHFSEAASALLGSLGQSNEAVPKVTVEKSVEELNSLAGAQRDELGLSTPRTWIPDRVFTMEGVESKRHDAVSNTQSLSNSVALAVRSFDAILRVHFNLPVLVLKFLGMRGRERFHVCTHDIGTPSL